MTPSPPEDRDACAWRDTAWGFVLGSTGPDETEAFREHLLEGCGACGAEVAHARTVIGDLDLATAQRTLRRGHGSTAHDEVRARLFAECAPTPPTTPFGRHLEDAATDLRVPTTFAGISLVPEADEGWVATGVDGVEFKTLVEDRERRTATALVRMAPGASYPPHRHGAREECYVLAGDLTFGEHRMERGDYQVAEKDSVHPVQTTEEGCLLLIVSSLDDEPVE